MEIALDFIVTFIFVVCNVVLATFVAVRAWDHLPARAFVAVVAVLVGIGITIFGQAIFPNSDMLYLVRAIQLSHLGPFTAAFIALLSAMFMPVWWEGRRPIIWILLPYILISALLAVDLLARLGLFVDRLEVSESGTRFITTGLGRGLTIVFSLSWLIPLTALFIAFRRDPQSRLPISVLGGSVVIALFLISLGDRLSPSPVLRGLIILMPFPIALAFAVFRTRLITPLRAAINQAFESMSDAAIVLTNTNQIAYANARAIALGFSANTALANVLQHINADPETVIAMRAGDPPQRLKVGERQLMVSLTALTNERGQRGGTLVMGRDVTDIEERTIQLEQERSHLAEVVHSLETEQRERAVLADTVKALALPIIPILEGVLVLPLVGVFDTLRMDDLQERLLKAIEHQRAKQVMLDLTGLSFLDAQGVVGLTRSVQAARLLGTRCVLVGVRPELAEAFVAQGLMLDDIPTAATLQDAVGRALRRTAQERQSQN